MERFWASIWAEVIARNLLVGKDEELGTDEQLTGHIDDLLVFGRTLTADEVKTLSEKGAEACITELIGRCSGAGPSRQTSRDLAASVVLNSRRGGWGRAARDERRAPRTQAFWGLAALALIVTLRNASSGVAEGKPGGLTASRPYREMETFNGNQHAQSRGAFIDQHLRCETR